MVVAFRAVVAPMAEEETNESVTATHTVIAINRDKNSQSAVKWAVEHLFNKKNSGDCILIHVRSQSLHPRRYPSPLLLMLFSRRHSDFRIHG